ncbi:MAG: helix-turn-helix domain-containing protein [Deltaproteobacteria bacterium]|nr:helix-turn-helix domain-containing protein [Deltaproteobacteria bacterium]
MSSDNPMNLDNGIWFTYEEAAKYCRWSKEYLRNLVCNGKIPVYGPPRRRRFRKDMLDLYIVAPNVAMRKFMEERRSAYESGV